MAPRLAFCGVIYLRKYSISNMLGLLHVHSIADWSESERGGFGESRLGNKQTLLAVCLSNYLSNYPACIEFYESTLRSGLTAYLEPFRHFCSFPPLLFHFEWFFLFWQPAGVCRPEGTAGSPRTTRCDDPVL